MMGHRAFEIIGIPSFEYLFLFPHLHLKLEGKIS